MNAAPGTAAAWLLALALAAAPALAGDPGPVADEARIDESLLEEAPAADDLVDGTLVLAHWRGAFLGRGVDGGVAVLRGPDGSVRAEVVQGPPDLATLLDRAGRGWTVILAGGGDGVLSPWDKEWSRLGATAAGGLRTIAAALGGREPAAGPGGAGPAGWSVVLPPPADPGFRGAMAARGRGRGGPGETLHLAWSGPAGPERTLAVRSTRRPGGLRFSGRRCLPVRFPAAEVFVPLWPLRELLEQVDAKPGTCPPGRGSSPGTPPSAGSRGSDR